jgi:hypothetical protein
MTWNLSCHARDTRLHNHLTVRAGAAAVPSGQSGSLLRGWVASELLGPINQIINRSINSTINSTINSSWSLFDQQLPYIKNHPYVEKLTASRRQIHYLTESSSSIRIFRIS